ncbi:uncharacterized protein STEHIDRAFT_60757 [Stereum hirsutum FP-91666 SS1]|uniref:uncharacterized protein n=1 Tax=Stereum hirsutum (strain FP-91666) TaxID=721885 RepID=UPI000444A747|nr:uncharacterized protein STEHIDRAFT_60757 [Stereum hirsutum FP-91666 SS1]EIM84841.1 hypothetical protein STEHIDRAFT_60757 [Stereum hirsutum FP-91666 SS1]
MDATNFDLESLVNLEQSFYDEGYADGHTHGRIHGLIEGRALGREKGFEMWEEMGFYTGFAKFWITVAESQTSNGTNTFRRAIHHARHLLSLLAQFPATNPSPAPAPAAPSSTSHTEILSATSSPSSELDISSLQRQIRSRYKVLCASLGIKPSLRANSSPGGEIGQDDGMNMDSTVNGPSEGRGGGKKIWKVDVSRGVGPQEPQGLSF